MESREVPAGISGDDHRLDGPLTGSDEGVSGVPGTAGRAEGSDRRDGDSEPSGEGAVRQEVVGAAPTGGRRRGKRSQRADASTISAETGAPTEGQLNLHALDTLIRRILSISSAARRLRRLHTKAAALAELGLGAAAAAARDEIDAIERDRELLLGMCDALREAAQHDGAAVESALRHIDASGALQALLAGKT